MRELEQVFKGLADQTRLRILNLLLHGELCVCDIQYVLESSQPNVSRHLTYLKNSGLVVDRREGARMYYRLAQPNEGEMEAFGALCSVGPTFLFPVMQSIIDAAMAAGLSESLARKAAAQVFVGTGKLVGFNERTVAELNGMIGLHTLREPETMKLITDAYNEALGKLRGLAAKMSAVA